MTVARPSASGPRPIWALVPAKAFDKAKSRLGSVLGPRDRAALARALLDHVLTVATASGELAGLAVVTCAPDVVDVAFAHGAVVLPEAAGAPLGAVVDGGLAGLAGLGAASALVLMSDLPLLERVDVVALARAMQEVDVVLAPDQADAGTNALGVGLVGRLPTLFGRDDSFARHRLQAERAGLRVTIHRSATVAFDVDTPGDLERLRGANAPSFRVPAVRAQGG